MIETLILGALALTGAAIIGYCIGKNKADTICLNYLGWEVTAFKCFTNDLFIVDFKKGKKRFTAMLDPTKDRIDWFLKDVIDEQR